MAAVSADNTEHMQTKLLSPDGYYVDLPVAASTTIYKNTFVGLNSTGYLTSYIAPIGSTTLTGNCLIGIAVENVNNSSGSAGDLTARVFVKGYLEYKLTSVAVLDVGCPVFAANNADLTTTAGLGHYAGKIIAYEKTNYCVIEFDPQQKWAGKFLTVVSPAIDYATDAHLVLLVHETENHNGMICCVISGYSTEAHMCATTAGVVTIGHTRGTDTTMGITLTAVDNSALYDSIIAAGGQLWAPASATDQAIVVAPAGKAIVAKVTTQSNEGTAETGQAKLFGQFMAL